MIVVNMAKARLIHRNAMRASRAPILAALDVAFMRAVESGDVAKQSEVAASKQLLRDVTALPEIDAASTPQALKSAWPSILGASPYR